MPAVTLLTRHECHLCDEARTVVEGVVEQLNRTERSVELAEVDVDADRALHDRWTDDVPVVLIDGDLHARWRVDPAALYAALAGPTASRP